MGKKLFCISIAGLMQNKARGVIAQVFLIVGFSLMLSLGFSQQDTLKYKEIELLNANSLEFDQSSGIDAKRLIGDVSFKHEGTTMFCDSAYLYTTTNSLKAFGHVKILSEDNKTKLFGDSLLYDGNEKMAKVFGKVKLQEEQRELTTPLLHYDNINKIASYYGGGKTINTKDKSTLESKTGHYYTNNKNFYFKDSVKIVHPNYTIYSDTMMHAYNQEKSYFYGPTTIIRKKGNVYCQRGTFDTKKGVYVLVKNAYVIDDGKVLSGDSIYYNDTHSWGEAFGRVSMVDTSEKTNFLGDYLFFNDTDSLSYITGHALMMQYDNKDTLFLHGDSLFSRYDSANSRLILAYRHVKFFRHDMQGLCDSLTYSESDSLLRMYGKPVLWSGDDQLSADYIIMNRSDGKVKDMHFYGHGFIASLVDSANFNQIKGDTLIGHFKDNELNMVEVFSNGKTIYYAKEEEKKDSISTDSITVYSPPEIMGINIASSPHMRIHLMDQQVQRIVFYHPESAVFYPPKDLSDKEKLLEGFYWLINDRPKIWQDVFIKKEPLPLLD